MDKMVGFVVIVQGIVLVGSLGLLIYFIIQRIEKKKQETFEDRDN